MGWSVSSGNDGHFAPELGGQFDRIFQDNNGYPGNIELFSMDMSVSYQAGQKEYFAAAEVVFDRFHIKKGINKALNLVRIEEVTRVESLKKSKYIWLKNEAKLTENQSGRLNQYLSDSTLNTTIAYQIKNKFDQLMYNLMQLNQ